MLLSGVNTYHGMQIKDNESKYALNCYNRDGKLQGQNYAIDFTVNPTDVYRRQYTTLDTGALDTSTDISRYTLRYEYEGEEYTSGLIKPKCVLYVDTTKFDTGSNGNYVKKISELNEVVRVFRTNDTEGEPRIESRLVGDELRQATFNFGKDCEVYKDVEIAVSYGGAYGESGLTKFRVTSNILHFFVAVHDVFKYKDNPNYEYLNIYVKYGNLDSLTLLNRISLKDLDDSFGKSINLKTDGDDRLFYTTYNYNSVSYYQEYDDGSYVYRYIDYNETTAQLASEDGTSALIYSGLFQFEDENKVNPSWYIVNKLVSIIPQADVETHTYLSTEDYDIERNVNDYLDSKYQYNDLVASSDTDTPKVTKAFSAIERIENTIDNDQIKFTNTKYVNGSANPHTYNVTDIDSNLEKTSSAYGNVAYGGSTNDWCQVWDLYEGLIPTNENPRDGFKNSISGSYYVQIWRSDNDNGRILICSQQLSLNGAKYNTIVFNDIVSKLDPDFDWSVDVWLNESSGDTPTDNFYRIMSIDVKYALEFYTTAHTIAHGGPVFEIDTEDRLVRDGVKYSYINIDYPLDPYLPSRDFGFVSIAETGNIAMFLNIAPNAILKKLDSHKTGLFDGDTSDYKPITDPINYNESADDVEYNPDGRFQDDYNTFASGVSNFPKLDYIDWRLRTKYIEEYDGRLWLAGRDKSDENAVGFKDLYYSQQQYPEMVLESNYKGYDNTITGLKKFIEQMYVFQDTQIDIVKKSLSRQNTGIVEPTYQYHKSFDKGAFDFTIKEFEKKLFFTNEDGTFYIDAGGNYNKASGAIDRLFRTKELTSEKIDYAEIKEDFYILKFKEEYRIPYSKFSDVELPYSESRVLSVQYIAYNINSETWWFGNDETSDTMFFYLTKDFDKRNKYENEFKKKQLKRISMVYDEGKCKVSQIRNNNMVIGEFWFPEKTADWKNAPKRHTLRGFRNFTYSFLISSEFLTKIVDFTLLENGK